MLALASMTSVAQEVSPVSELVSAAGKAGISESLFDSPQQRLGDCSLYTHDELDDMAARDGRPSVQWIGTRAYAWTTINSYTQFCVYLTMPKRVGLTRVEAAALLAASIPGRLAMEMPYPEAQVDSAQMAADAALDRTAADAAAPMDSPGAKVDILGLTPWNQSTYAFSAVAYVTFEEQPNGVAASQGSALQISPYVYVTAAHLAFNPTTRAPLKNGRIYPHYRVPDPTQSIRITEVIVPNEFALFDIGDPRNIGNDLAFLNVTEPTQAASSSGFPSLRYTDSRLDLGLVGGIGHPESDPFFINGWEIPGALYPSWFYPPPYTINRPMQMYMLGYPLKVGAVINKEHRAYVSTGQLASGTLKELIYHCPPAESFCHPYWETLNEAAKGMSGGPMIGRMSIVNDRNLDFAWQYAIIGIENAIVTDSTGDAASIGSGYFDFNSGYIATHVGWTPDPKITLGNPVNGYTYDVSQLPLFTGNAGTSTSSLTWTSDIDGLLGTGGSVNVVGKLSQGEHAITIQIGNQPLAEATTVVSSNLGSSSVPSSSVGSSKRVVTIHVTAQPSTLTASPNPVLAPNGAAFGMTTLSWSAPSYAAVDLVLTVNGSQSLLRGAAASSGSVVIPIYVGNSYKLDLYRPGNRTEILATTTVTGKPGPIITATPNPVVIPAGGSTGTTMLNWNSQGVAPKTGVYVSVDGAALTLVATNNQSGSVSVNWIQLNHRYEFFLCPQDNGQLRLASTVVLAQAMPTPTFTATPNPVPVAAGQTSATYTLAWSTPGYSQVDVYGDNNLTGQVHQFLGTAASPGSAPEPIELGERAVIKFYPHGDATTLLGSVNITATSPAVISASPNPVIIPANVTTTNYTLSWNTPGFAEVDVYGDNNLTGQVHQYLGSIASPGALPEPISVGETAVLYFYPKGDGVHLLGKVTVVGRH